MPSPRTALIVDCALADHTLDLLRTALGAGAIAAVRESEHYALIFFGGSDAAAPWLPALYWDGHMPIRISDPALLAQVNLRDSGIPVFSSSQFPSEGFFKDGWTNGRGRILKIDCPVPAGAEQLLLISRGLRGSFSPEQIGLEIRINDIQAAYLGSDGPILRFALPGGIDRVQSLEIRSSTFKPTNGDSRSLGMDVAYLMLR